MSISIESIITWVGMFIGLLGVWFRNQFKIERLEEKHDEHVISTEKKHEEYVRQIEAIWRKADESEKEATATREKLNRDIGDLKGTVSVNSEQFRQVINILTEIKERLTRLENTN